MKRLFFLFCLMGPLHATQWEPWFSPLWEFQFNSFYSYDRLNRFETPAGDFTAKENDHFLDLGLGITPWPYINVEAGIQFTNKENAFGFCAALLTLRNQLFAERSGDPFTLTVGVTGFYVPTRWLNDLSITYHGEANVNFHTSIGKELEPFRIWGYGAIGIANRGSAWVTSLVSADVNFYDCATLAFYSYFLYGLGDRDVDPSVPFEGFASINHQQIDVGTELRVPLSFYATLGAGYAYRVHARNFYKNVHIFTASLNIPFGL